MAAGSVRRFQRLDAAAVVRTLAGLQLRIVERFPERGLNDVAANLAVLLGDGIEDSDVQGRRVRALRGVCNVVAGVVVVGAITALWLVVRDAFRAAEGTPAFQRLPVLESGINDLVFGAIAVLFLLTAPSRVRRRRSLAALHELRSLAHVIDMHQLAKDPHRLRPEVEPTDATPHSDLSKGDMGRYLEYCSELLALVGKAAALQAQESADPVVLDGVAEIESLTVGMSRKIWQKISMLSAE